MGRCVFGISEAWLSLLENLAEGAVAVGGVVNRMIPYSDGSFRDGSSRSASICDCTGTMTLTTGLSRFPHRRYSLWFRSQAIEQGCLRAALARYAFIRSALPPPGAAHPASPASWRIACAPRLVRHHGAHAQ
jgi:hypothetical protein